MNAEKTLKIYTALCFCLCTLTACAGRGSAQRPAAGTEKGMSDITLQTQSAISAHAFTAQHAPLQAFDYIDTEGLSRAGMGFGPGTRTDGENRPLSALAASELYAGLGAVYFGKDEYIYLTFDCGYENGNTEKILDALAVKDVQAAFFVTLPFAQQNPEIVARILEDGHVLGNHSATHRQLPLLSDEETASEVMLLHEHVLQNHSYTMRLFRFPEGYSSEHTLAAVNNLGYRSVFWSFAYLDWDQNAQPDKNEALAKITGAAHGGAVYLLHAVSATNAEILPAVIDELHAQGYTFGTF